MVEKDTLEQDIIVDCAYHLFDNSTVTVCMLICRNGFKVIGYSACVNPAEFDAALGRRYAYEDALTKLWELEGYLAAEKSSSVMQEIRPAVFKELSNA